MAANPSFRMSVFFTVAVVASCGVARGQCTTSTCTVTTYQQLLDALACYEADPIDCSRIIVPSNASFNVPSQISLDSDHDGLHLTINGTLTYTGGFDPNDAKMFNLAGCDNLTVDGSGHVTSDEDPFTTGSSYAIAFRVNGCDGVTIQGLTISQFTTAIKCQNNASTNLSFIGLTLNNHSEYGIFASNPRSTVKIRNCVVNNTDFHGIRTYADNSEIINCSSYSDTGTAIWVVEGTNVTVLRVSGQERLRFGPDHGTGSVNGSRLTNFNAFSMATDDHVKLEMGLIDACVVSMCGNLSVGRDAEEIPAEEDRPMVDVHWDAYSGSFEQVPNDHYSNVADITYNFCFEDIAGGQNGLPDTFVDVTDLLAVIGAWGSCPAAPVTVTLAHPPCPADVAPEICGDREVDVTDLLAVIGAWGECPSNPTCGSLAARNAQLSEGAPQSIQDCYEECLELYPGGGQDFANCYNDCVEALCRAQIIECD